LTGQRDRERGREQADEGLAADMALLDELLDVVVRRGQHLSDEDLDRVLGVGNRQRRGG
jgi:hypothetical protein